MLAKVVKKEMGGSDGKESACNAGDLGLIPGLGRSPREGKGCPLQYSGLENSMDFHGVHGVHGVAKELDTIQQLSLSLHCLFHETYENIDKRST